MSDITNDKAGTNRDKAGTRQEKETRTRREYLELV